MSDKNIEPKVSFWQTAPGCITAIGGLLTAVITGIVALSTAGFIDAPFSAASSSDSDPVTNNANSPSTSITVKPANTLAPITQPSSISPSSITWVIDAAGICRDDTGDYPRWSSYDWTLSQCEEACQNNPNCQGFAMSTQKNYCQLFGSDGNNAASNPGVQITRGDKIQPDFSCYLKSSDQSSISTWTMDSTGVCRDNAGGYPRWSSYDWAFSQCEAACQNNPNCQGFAMAKDRNYCQLFGSDGSNAASNPGTQITQGDKTQPDFACYIKR